MTTYHIGLDIAGTLRQPNKVLNGLLSDEGRNLSAKEVRHFLHNLRVKNPKQTLFTGDRCDNQGPDGGCLGHPDKESGQ